MQAEEPIPTIADRMCNIASEIKLTKRKEGKKVRLLAVSKFQGISKIVSAFEAGQHHFGENYIEELATKSRELSGIKWHMIGHIQKNKIGRLLNVEGLYMIESLDSIKLAKGLEKGLNKFGIDVEGVINRLKVLIQINISGEKRIYIYIYMNRKIRNWARRSNSNIKIHHRRMSSFTIFRNNVYGNSKQYNRIPNNIRKKERNS